MQKVKANIIIELMGRPKEHLKEALKTLVVKMGSEKGVRLIDKRYHSPKAMKKTDNLFVSFAEINMEFDSLEYFFAIIMGYMPSNVEIYEPERFKLNTHELNSFSNYIVSKLHRYDELAKRALVERDILLKQLQYIKSGGKIENLMRGQVQNKVIDGKKAEKKKGKVKEKPKAKKKK
jgi:hypothetical protein